MKTTVKFLDAVRKKHGFTSDYQLSKYLNCTRGAISSYRTGRTFLDEEMACKVAADLGLDSDYVLACIASERAKLPEVKAAWKHTADVLYGLAAALAVVAILPFITLPDSGLIDANVVYYVKWHAPIIWALLPLILLLFFLALKPFIMARLTRKKARYARPQ